MEFYFFTVNLYQSYVSASPAKLQISFNTGVPQEGKILGASRFRYAQLLTAEKTS